MIEKKTLMSLKRMKLDVSAALDKLPESSVVKTHMFLQDYKMWRDLYESGSLTILDLEQVHSFDIPYASKIAFMVALENGVFLEDQEERRKRRFAW